MVSMYAYTPPRRIDDENLASFMVCGTRVLASRDLPPSEVNYALAMIEDITNLRNEEHPMLGTAPGRYYLGGVRPPLFLQAGKTRATGLWGGGILAGAAAQVEPARYVLPAPRGIGGAMGVVNTRGGGFRMSSSYMMGGIKIIITNNPKPKWIRGYLDLVEERMRDGSYNCVKNPIRATVGKYAAMEVWDGMMFGPRPVRYYE